MLLQLCVEQSNGIYSLNYFFPYGTENLQEAHTSIAVANTAHYSLWSEQAQSILSHSSVCTMLSLYSITAIYESIQKAILFERIISLPYW